MALTGVFLSAVTNEFGRARETVASNLRAKKYSVMVQEDFRQEGGSSTTLDKLDAYIRDCEAVVCIVGRRSGAVPPRAAMEPYVQHLPPGLGHPSYTQWELILARAHNKKLFVFHATPDYEPDEPEPSGDDHPDLQAAFVKWLFTDQGLDRDQFSDTKDLQIDLLMTDLGTVAGERRAGSQTDAGWSVSEQKAPLTRRKDPAGVNRLKQNRRPLIGRDDELEDLLAVVEGRFENLILLVGAPGIGKRAILQELSHSDQLPDDFADGAGIHPVLTGQEDGEDFRQAIWEEFYDTDTPNTAVLPRQRLKDLKDIEALIVVPDIDPYVEFIPDLLEEMADTFICGSAASDSVDDLGDALQEHEEIPIDGLPDDEALALFEDRYRGAVPDEARADILALCAERDGNPAKIGLLATDAKRDARPRRNREGPHPLVAWAAAQRGHGTEPADASPAESAGQERAMAAARAARTEVPAGVLAPYAGSEGAIDELLEDERLEEGSPRYRLNPVLETADDLDSPTGTNDVMHALMEHTLAWAVEADYAELYANRAFAVRMMEWSLARGHEIFELDDVDAVRLAHRRWRDVIRLGITVEPAVALGGRHGAWDDVLRLVESAARADLELSIPGRTPSGTGADDRQTSSAPEPSAQEALGWALHQRGSRALLRDDLKTARAHLNGSLRHRESDEGRELTRRNLLLLPLAVVPFAALLLVPLFLVSIAASQLFPFDSSVATADITPDALVFAAEAGDVDPRQCPGRRELDEEAGGGVSCQFTVRNVGSGSVWLASINEPENASAFDLLYGDDRPEGECEERRSLAPEEVCTITIVSSGGRDTAVLEMKVVARSSRDRGDQSALLVSRP